MNSIYSHPKKKKKMRCVMELDVLILNFIWKNKYQPIIFFKVKKKIRKYLSYWFLRTTAPSTELEQIQVNS